MSRTLAKVRLIGNVGGAPEMRYTPTKGTPVVTISVAHNRKIPTAQGDSEQTDWHRVKIIGTLATVMAEMLRPGVKVYVEGDLVVNKWQDRNTGGERQAHEVVIAPRNGGQLLVLSAKDEQQ